MKKTTKRIIIALVIFITVVLIVPSILSFGFYQSYFGKRYESNPSKMRHVEDYEGLKRDRYEITSDKGQKIVAYNYHTDTDDIKGIIIMAHGIGGGGHNSYMDFANDFAQSGYYAFAYDVTGNDESEGKAVNGLPQGVIDLNHVISFVEQQDEFKGLPIGLFGHSWGGYSVANSLNEHPEVDCVVSVAGFSKTTDLFKYQGKQMIGPVINVFVPYLYAIDKIKFGKYADETAMDGFAKTDAKVLIIHGGMDDTVPKDYGYDIYYEKYGNDPDFEFIYVPEDGHNNILNDEKENIIGRIIEFYDTNMN